MRKNKWKKMHSATKVYAFDVDGPIYDGNIPIELAADLANRGKFNPAVYQRFARMLSQYKQHKISYAIAAPKLIRLLGQGMRGQPKKEIEKTVARLIAKNKARFFPKAIKKLKKLQKKHPIALISFTLPEGLEKIRRLFGIRAMHTYGIGYQTRHGIFTGKLLVPNILKFKKDCLWKISHSHKIPASHIIFFGDQVTDLESALQVGAQFQPMNPSKELKKILKHKKSRQAKK